MRPRPLVLLQKFLRFREEPPPRALCGPHRASHGGITEYWRSVRFMAPADRCKPRIALESAIDAATGPQWVRGLNRSRGRALRASCAGGDPQGSNGMGGPCLRIGVFNLTAGRIL